ncbi:MAG: hypothetical protein DRP59_06785 [Spirochaetes bacterium]|nr:MAG: hypothetical protein DRP59_06785 [Spirochaetota bacterium]
MHRIQRNSIPVPQSEGNKSSRPEPKGKGENFDAVIKKEKEKGKTGVNPSKKKLDLKKTAESADSGLRVKEKKTPVTKKSSDNKEKSALKLSVDDVHRVKGKKLKGKKLDFPGMEKGIAGTGDSGTEKGKKIKNPESLKAAEVHKKDELKEKPVEPHYTAIFAEPAVQKMDTVKEHKATAKRTEAVAEKKKGSGKKELKHASESKILDLRSSADKRSVVAKNSFTGDNPSGDNNSKSSSEQSTAAQVITLTAKGDVPLQTQFSGEMEPKTVLLNELHDTLNDKIVKQSSIILKDGDAGEIRLILKPESLGKVRIRLHMDENNLSGKIFVDNAAVKEIFEQNMFRLERAFSENGFSMGSLDVSVGDKGSGNPKEKNSLVSEKTIKIIEDSIPGIDEDVYSSNVIDLVV